MKRMMLSLAACLTGMGACAAATGTPVSEADAARKDERGALLEGVESIASAGVPGPVVVLGEGAFAVIAGAQGDGSRLPVVGASVWGRGRVLAFGHGGMIGSEALKHPGTARLVENGVRWLGDGEMRRIGVDHNDAMVAMLRTRGIDAVAIDAGRADGLDGCSVVVVDSHRMNDAIRERLRAFVKDGGGLMTAGLGWGWLQLNPGRSILEHPGNLLLTEAGLAWGDGTLKPGASGVFAAGDADELESAEHALKKLAGSGADFTPQESATIASALEVLPAEHALFGMARGLAGHVTGWPSASKPLKREAARERALVALRIQVDARLPAEEVGACAAEFPGAVPADAARVARTVEVDLGVPGWHGTGLYAPAGEVIRVRVEGEAKGLSVRIGCHSDKLWGLAEWRRAPEISRVWGLGEVETRAASAFGGLVYVETPRGGRGRVRVSIEGAVESPRFVLGVTSAEEWKRSRSAAGPWGELESDRVIVSVPSEHLRGLDDPAALLEQWNRISDAHAELARVQAPPQRPHRYVADEQISAGYMHSGYPIMTHLDAAADMTSLEAMERGPWGLLHELGHNHQEVDWTFGGTTEVTCNLFALHAIDTVCKGEGRRGHRAVTNPPSVKGYVEAGADFETWKKQPFLALQMYIEMEEGFGWETFKRVFEEYRGLKREERPKNDAEKRDQWMVRFSRACGRNLGPFFEAWGVPTSAEARASIADLPGWMPEGWPEGE